MFGGEGVSLFTRYAVPTPKEFTLQPLGRVISNALAIHIHDAKRGTLKRKRATSPAEHVHRPAGLTDAFLELSPLLMALPRIC